MQASPRSRGCDGEGGTIKSVSVTGIFTAQPKSWFKSIEACQGLTLRKAWGLTDAERDFQWRWQIVLEECVHMTSRRPCWRSKQTNGGHLGGVKYYLGIKLYFYANPSFCFILQIWLLVTWANTLRTKMKPQFQPSLLLLLFHFGKT